MLPLDPASVHGVAIAALALLLLSAGVLTGREPVTALAGLVLAMVTVSGGLALLRGMKGAARG